MGGLRVLVVDDDRDFADSLAAVIELEVGTVEVVFSGEEAVERFKEADFDLVFMDLRLPGMNGLESFLEILRLEPDARVVMMTGYSVEQLLDQAVEDGAWAVLHKPFDPDDVIKIIHRIEPAGILIVDDDPDFAEGIRGVLEQRGHRVFVARDGRAATERVMSGGIDVLILDLRLPVLSGLGAYHELKKKGHALPTIIVTAYAKEEADALDRFRLLSVTNVLRKPFEPERLLSAVDELVARR